MKRLRGFTLIELMIAVAIVAILTAIAVPAYTDYVRRGRIMEALAALSGMRIKMEQYFQDNRTYVNACAAGTIAPLPANTVNFAYACAGLGLTTYTITATGQPGSSVDGFQYTLNESNVRTTVMAPPSTWPGNPACWVVKKDGSC